MVHIDKSGLEDPGLTAHREWLEANGLGGFASSTVTGANTRRYHGLLVASMQPPVRRVLLLAKLEETLVVDGCRFELGSNHYPGSVHPEGFRFLDCFELDLFPTWRYKAGGVDIEKTIFMPHGENTVVAEWRLRRFEKSVRDVRLEVRPMTAFRDFHALTHENDAANKNVDLGDGVISLRLYDAWPALHFAHNANGHDDSQFWFRTLEYPLERERGLEYQEDLFSPFGLHFSLSKKNPSARIIASVVPHGIKDVDGLRAAETKRRKALTAKLPKGQIELAQLTRASDQFIVQRGDSKSVIAGYPWFCDWGRDTMIALPGLALATRRFDDARAILTTFMASLDQGMLPNRFSDHGETPEYNTVDATLWLFHAVDRYRNATGDMEFIRGIYPQLADVVSWHIKGTRHGIRCDVDGLLRAGEPGLQLTWMDAKIGDRVVTPRAGKPVEVQALWHNALCVMALLAKEFDDKENEKLWSEMAAHARDSFEKQFWNAEGRCLYDVVDDGLKDPSIRPNQLLALSLPHPLLAVEMAGQVLSKVERELLTPFGLRTLSSHDPHYQGAYRGGVEERDSAYHQGTVWPWLLGPYVDALFNVRGMNKATRAQAQSVLQPLLDHMNSAGIGELPEVFSGDPPHAPGGCMAQAWSVAELLRVLIRATHEKNPAKRRPPNSKKQPAK